MANLSQTTAQIQTIINTAIDNPMTSAGDLIVGVTGSDPIRLEKGSSKQVLAVNSSANGLEWKSLGGGATSSTTYVDLEVSGNPFDSSGYDTPSWSFSSQTTLTSAQMIINAITTNNKYVVFRFTDSNGTTYVLPVISYYSSSYGQFMNYSASTTFYPGMGGVFNLTVSDSTEYIQTTINSYYSQS